MQPQAVHEVLAKLEQSLTSCLGGHGVGLCSFIWPGCVPPRSCDKDAQLAIVYTPSLRMVDSCSFSEYLDISIYLDFCQGSPDSAEQANQIAQDNSIIIYAHNALGSYLNSVYEDGLCNSVALIHSFQCYPDKEEDEENRICNRFLAKMLINGPFGGTDVEEDNEQNN